jgi:hypothetical protein
MSMKIKGVIAALLGIATLAGASAPAAAQDWGYRDHRGGYDRGDRYRDYRDYRDYRRDRDRDRRHWRSSYRDDRGWRGHHRQRCWSEWRYDRRYDERVRVRICR